MNRHRSIALVAIAALSATLALGSGCAKKKPTDQVGDNKPFANLKEPPPPLSLDGSGGSDPLGLAGFGGGAGGDSGFGIPQGDSMRVQPAGMISDLQTVYFEHNSADLSPTAMATLDANASWMMSNPAIHVQVEGHCDDTGTLEYNLNLGQMRADIAREYLAHLGVDAARLHTISYGEERPISEDRNQNRRVQFLVYDPNS